MNLIGRTLILAVLLACPASPAQDQLAHPDIEKKQGRLPPPELNGVPSEVKDRSGIFSAEAARSAREALEKLHKASGMTTVIETIDTLSGDTIDEAAMRIAKQSGISGIFVLIAKKESKIEVLVSRKFNESISRTDRQRIRTQFIENFRHDDFDRGLRNGVAAIESVVATARRENRLPSAKVLASPRERDSAKPGQEGNGPAPPLAGLPDLRDVKRAIEAKSGEKLGSTTMHANTSAWFPETPLIVRDRVHLTLEGARTIIAAAKKQAGTLNLKMNIAVVDDGGHLLSFDRMDGARPASAYTALTKATTAATFRQDTGPLPVGTTTPDPLLNISLQNAAASSGGKITTLHGGVPVIFDSQVIGGVGVGGGTGEQDALVAKAGIEALIERLVPAKDSSHKDDSHGKATTP